MAVDIHNLIAAIAPDLYCDKKSKDKVKDIIKSEISAIEKRVKEKKEKGEEVKDSDYDTSIYLTAAKDAKVAESDLMDFFEALKYTPFQKKGLKNPIEKHFISYDAFSESLEPIYFWIIDYINPVYGKSTKLVDNFIASPGSGMFSEFGQKATRMQDEGMKILGAANQVVKSVLNILYDLKEFDTRLEVYKKLKSQKKEERDSAMLSLKQIWLDTVDMKRGNTSVKGMAFAQGTGFVTLIDAFMAAENEKLEMNGAPMDLNDRVKRILQQRLGEFFIWIKESEIELTKRYNVEKLYLKSQVNTLKLYARWAKPYLMAAKQLEMNTSGSTDVVNIFNTSVMELKILGEGKYKPEDDIAAGDLPKSMENVSAITKRSYIPIVIVEFNFRSSPERTQQGGYGQRGRVNVTFTSYALNDVELDILKKQIEKDDMGDVIKQVTGATDETLAQMQSEIDKFLGDEKKSDKKKKEESTDINPFSALFDLFKGSKSDQKEEKPKFPPKDSELEKVFRSQAILEARRKCAKMYETYKKAHGLPTFPLPF